MIGKAPYPFHEKRWGTSAGFRNACSSKDIQDRPFLHTSPQVAGEAPG